MPKNKHKDILKIKAKEDFEAAKKLIESEEFSEEIVLFHCQQAIEKALKAYLDSKGIIYPKTHDLETLMSLCIKSDSSFGEVGEVIELTPFAVEIRYNEFVEIERSETVKLLNKTKKALNFILKKI